VIALLDNLKTYLPFSLLDHKALKRIEESAQIAYYPDNTVLIDVNEMPSTFFLIIKGIVEAKDAEELIDIYQVDDVFGGIELI
jgi:CBS domain-containing protein